MEIADIFVVNKADREGASIFASHLKKLSHERSDSSWETPVVLTQAIHNIGLQELIQKIDSHFLITSQNLYKRSKLLTEKAFKIIQSQRMTNVTHQQLEQDLEESLNKTDFNLFSFVEKYFI